MSAQPLGQDALHAIAARALEISGVDGAEVYLSHDWGGLTRFANSQIHQSHWREDTVLRVRVAMGDRTAVAVSNDATPTGARTAAVHAREMADVAASDPHWPGFSQPGTPTPERETFDVATAAASPEARADVIREVFARAGDLRTAGAVETQASEIMVANTNGVVRYAECTQASVNAVMSGPNGGTGFAESLGQTIGSIDGSAVGIRAAEKAHASERPGEIPAGNYSVVLEPSAVSTIAGFLTYIGFGGRAYIEGRSCLSGKAGQPVAASTISITEDPFDPRTLGITFDPEGTPKERVALIRDGIFLDTVYDRRVGQRADRASTGNALPPPETDGPFPSNLRFEAGDSSIEAMIKATDRGVLVTRFHYSNVVNAAESIITGMTRDGTFLIENGEVTRPVRNLRFTQSILDALAHTTHVGADLELASEFFSWPSLVPALRLERFAFSSVSDH